MKVLKALAVIVLLLGVSVIAGPAPAQANHAERKSWDLGEILEFGGQAMTEAIQRGIKEIQDHFEVHANVLPGSEGNESSTQLRLRLFPKGKDHPEEQMGADTQFQYSLDPKRPHFNFDFKLLPRQNPDDYL
jgi:hypothetical protein